MKKPLTAIFVIALLLLVAALPFHYLPDHGKVLFKSNMTFKNTIVTMEDVDEIISDYNNSKTLREQEMISSRPLVITLLENGILSPTEELEDY